MNTELVVALISGGIALVSAGFALWGQFTSAQLAADLQNLQLAEARRLEREKTVSRYWEPLARAAYDLQSRLYKILTAQGFMRLYSENKSEMNTDKREPESTQRMQTERSLWGIVSLLVLLTLFPAFGPDRVLAQRQIQISPEMLETLSQELGGPTASLQIVDQKEMHLKYLDRRVTILKVHHPETKQTHEITLDASGKNVDLRDLLAQDRAAKKARFGVLDPALHALLETKTGSDLVKVSIWIIAPDDPLPSPTPEEFETKGADVIRQEMEILVQEKKARLSALEQPIVEMIKTMGGAVLYADELAPIVSAHLTKDQILSLATLPEIDTIYHSSSEGAILGGSQRPQKERRRTEPHQ